MQQPSDLPARYPEVSFGHDVQIIGLANTALGAGTCVGDASWINVCFRDDRVRLSIGRNVLIGRQAMLSAGEYLEVGDFCLFAPRVYLSSADHIYQDTRLPIVMQGATPGRRLLVEENCWLGINAVVSGNLTVGRGSVVAANSVVNRDVPPFCVVAGSPARIVKMYNPRHKAWEKVAGDADIRRIGVDRALAGLPDRDAYRALLEPYARQRLLDPIVAGRGVSI